MYVSCISYLQYAIETPSNPQLKVTDIQSLSSLAKEVLGEENVTVIVDATLASPYLLRPLSLGADFSLHSCTKYIGGHSDVLGGVVTAANTPSANRLLPKLRLAQQIGGGVLSPFESYLALRGMRSLHVRMERHCSNAFTVAKFLSAHAKIEKVFYPGLPSHPQHTLASVQMNNRFMCRPINFHFFLKS